MLYLGSLVREDLVQLMDYDLRRHCTLRTVVLLSHDPGITRVQTYLGIIPQSTAFSHSDSLDMDKIKRR